MNAATSPDPDKPSWLPLAITLAIQAMVSMAMLVMPVMAPVVAPVLGIPTAFIGFYVAIAYCGGILGSLGGGTLVARFGAIRVSQGGLVLCAAGLALCAIPWLPSLALGAFFCGLGYGPITPASSHLLARTTPVHRMSLVFSVKQTGVPAGGILAGALIPPAMLLFGWQWALLMSAAACIACVFLAAPLRRAFDADRKPGVRLGFSNLTQPFKLVLSYPVYVMLGVCSMVFAMTQQILGSYLVTYLHETLAYGLVVAGLAMSAAQLGGVGGRILWGWMADRWFDARRMLAFLAGVMTACALLTAMLTSDMPRALVVAVLFVFGASAIGWNGVYLAEVARRAPPGMASVATGGMLAITFIGVVVGPALFGAIVAWTGSYRIGFLVFSVPLAACCIAFMRAKLEPVKS